MLCMVSKVLNKSFWQLENTEVVPSSWDSLMQQPSIITDPPFYYTFFLLFSLLNTFPRIQGPKLFLEFLRLFLLDVAFLFIYLAAHCAALVLLGHSVVVLALLCHSVFALVLLDTHGCRSNLLILFHVRV